MATSLNLRSSLKSKTERLLWESAIPGRQRFVESFLEPLLECCSVGLVGGAVRDLAFKSVREFKSDLDFVVSVYERALFDRLTSRFALTSNAFGGYRAVISGLRVDLWEAQKSWAHINGHCNVESIADVCSTTFFNLDSIVFDVGKRKLIVSDQTVQEMRQKILDINLRPNPNEEGAAVRGLRRLWTHELFASHELISFIAERIDAVGWSALVDRDRKAFPHAPILGDLFPSHNISGAEFSKNMNKNNGCLSPIQQLEFNFG